MKIVKINGEDPFKSIPITEEYRKKHLKSSSVATHRHRKFSLIYTFNEHCTSDKNFIVVQINENEKYYDRDYYLVEFLD